MKNYEQPNLRIDESRMWLDRQSQVYNLIEDIPRSKFFKKIVGDDNDPCITILNQVHIGDKILSEILDRKKPQIVDCDIAKLETKYFETVIVIANIHKPVIEESVGFSEDFANCAKHFGSFIANCCRRFRREN